MLAVTLCVAAAPVSAVASSGAASAPGVARVPQGFVGMNLGVPASFSQARVAHQLDRMVASGVERVRVVFDWAQAQPSSNAAPSFAATDQIVGLAAARGLTVLPTVLYTPGWDATPNPLGGFASPAQPGPYADYLKALVGRYGPRGTFWSQNQQILKVPIRMWQIWNEPNIPGYWSIQPFAPSYVTLVSAAHAAIKSVDPGAKVVLAGMDNFAWISLKQIYKVPGAGQAFDVVAVHPYTSEPGNVIRYLLKMRGVMKKYGDRRKPLIATEMGWPSALGKQTLDRYSFDTSESGQANRLATLLPLLVQDRVQLRLLGFDYYTWIGEEYPNARAFNYSGLLRYHGGKVSAKPALRVFRSDALAMEGCRKKSRVATRCQRRA